MALEAVVAPVGLRLRCPAGHGQAVAEPVVARLTSPEEAQAILRAPEWATTDGTTSEVLDCPWCARAMRGVAAPARRQYLGEAPDADAVRVDVCALCQVVWFDTGELERLPRATTVRTPSAPVPLTCERCGAPCRPDLDAYCTYCAQPLAPAQQPLIAPPATSPVPEPDTPAADDVLPRWLGRTLKVLFHDVDR